MSNKTLIIGDCHVGKGTKLGRSVSANSLNTRILDQMKIFNWILQTGISEDVNRFVFTGDVFEEMKPDHNLLVLFLDWLKECVSYGIECHIIAGNHDLKRVGNKYSSILDVIERADIEGVSVYNHLYTLHTEGVSFTLIPFRDKRSLECSSCEDAIEKLMGKLSYEVSDIPVENDKVCIGHLAIEDSFYTDEIDDLSNELMIPTHWFDNYDYVWMGHVHMPQVMKKKDPYIAHVGSMDLSDFGECDQTKIVVLFDPDDSCKFKNIDIPSRPLVRFKIDVPEDEDPTEFVLCKIIDSKKDLDSSIVSLEVKITNPDADDLDRSSILEVLNNKNVYHLSRFSESKSSVVVSTNKMHITDNAIQPKDAVKLVSDIIEHDDDNEKIDFVSLCNEVIEEYEVNKK